MDGIDQANPQRIEPRRKIAIPESMTALRPLASESFPNTIVIAVWGEEERREHPAVQLQPAEPADDLRHGGGDDRRLDRDHEIRRHDGGEHERPMSCKSGHGRAS